MKTVSFLILLSFSIILENLAQESISLSQYTTSISLVNPAYSGASGRFTAQLISRNQWMGIEGAPKTNALLINSPITKFNIGLGAALLHAKIGPINEFHFNLNTAYHTKLNDKINLSFGLKSMVALYKFDYIGDKLVDLGDPYFQDIPKAKAYVNFGAGIYIYSKDFFIAYSATPLLKNKIKTDSESDIGFYEINNTMNHYLMGAYSFDVKDKLVLKPSVMLKSNNNLKTTFDISLTAIYKQLIWFGATYRTSKTLSFSTQLQIGKKMRIGYAFDFGTSKEYSLNAGSHELICTMDIQLTKKQFITPRYF